MPALRLRLVDGDAPARSAPAAAARPLEPELLALIDAMAAAAVERDLRAEAAARSAGSTPAESGVTVTA